MMFIIQQCLERYENAIYIVVKLSEFKIFSNGITIYASLTKLHEIK